LLLAGSWRREAGGLLLMKLKETVYRWIFTVLAFSSLLFLAGIVIVLFREGLPVFKEVNLFHFLFGKSWYPTYTPPEYGILSLVLASFWITAGAMAISVPLGIGSALYIHELAGEKQKAVLKPLIELLAAIPSIIFGFFGMVIVAPFLQNLLHIPTGLCAFTASVVLGLMAVPTITSIADDALSYVPRSFKEASYALGANRWQTLTRVVIPAAGSGISTAVILGMSRIVGETMTVLMVAGGAAVVPTSFFQPVRPMTSTIAAEMGEAVIGSTHYSALFAIGLVLFLITLVFNIAAEHISRKYRIKLGLNR
jgi:phosphate transport system permease protein